MEKQLIIPVKKTEYNLVLLALSSTMFLLRSIIPYAIFIFAILQIILIFNTLRNNRPIQIYNKLKKSISSLYSYYLVVLFFIVGFIINQGDSETYKDILNLIILLSFIILYIIELD